MDPLKLNVDAEITCSNRIEAFIIYSSGFLFAIAKLFTPSWEFLFIVSWRSFSTWLLECLTFRRSFFVHARFVPQLPDRFLLVGLSLIDKLQIVYQDFVHAH